VSSHPDSTCSFKIGNNEYVVPSRVMREVEAGGRLTHKEIVMAVVAHGYYWGYDPVARVHRVRTAQERVRELEALVRLYRNAALRRCSLEQWTEAVEEEMKSCAHPALSIRV
jgi:hypothetical protein